MKNNIVCFSRPITFFFCMGKIKCWVRSLGYDHKMVCFAWDGMKLVSRIDRWSQAEAKEYAELLISEALGEKNLSIPFMPDDTVISDIVFFDDPAWFVPTFYEETELHPESSSVPLYDLLQSEEAARDEFIMIKALELSKEYPAKSFKEWLQWLQKMAR